MGVLVFFFCCGCILCKFFAHMCALFCTNMFAFSSMLLLFASNIRCMCYTRMWFSILLNSLQSDGILHIHYLNNTLNKFLKNVIELSSIWRDKMIIMIESLLLHLPSKKIMYSKMWFNSLISLWFVDIFQELVYDVMEMIHV